MATRGTLAAERSAGDASVGLRKRIQLGDTELAVLDVPAGGAPVRRICRTSVPTLELLLPLSAPVVVRDDSRTERAVRSDEGLYLVGCRRYTVYSPRGCTAVTAAVPIAAINDYIDRNNETGGLFRGSAVLMPVKRFVESVLETPTSINRLSEYFLEKMVWEMVASLLLERRGAGGLAAPSTSLRDQAVARIAAYRTDPSLTPQVLAQSLNISTRQLQRVFSATGSTPAREIRRHRADLAVSMLRNPAYRVLNVTQIAHHSGFADAAELRRALESLGYPNPSSIRRE